MRGATSPPGGVVHRDRRVRWRLFGPSPRTQELATPRLSADTEAATEADPTRGRVPETVRTPGSRSRSLPSHADWRTVVLGTRGRQLVEGLDERPRLVDLRLALVGVERTRRDLRPASRPLAERFERLAHETRIRGHVNDAVPVAVHVVVGRRPGAAISPHLSHTLRRAGAGRSRWARDVVTTIEEVLRHGGGQEHRPTYCEDPHRSDLGAWVRIHH